MADFDRTVRRHPDDCNGANYVVTIYLRYLTRSKDYLIGQEQVINSYQVMIGRGENCDVCYDDSFKTVSRIHASITKDGKDWMLTNLSKSNPTLINGRPIKKSWYLSSGDVIQLSFEGPKIEFIVRTVLKEVKKPTPASVPQSKIEKKAISNEDKDELETIYQIVSFCFPIIGAVIWLVNMKSSPNKAKTACYAALFGIIAGFVLNVIAAAGVY